MAAALLLEELTYGGLVRLLLAPRPDTGKPNEPNYTNWRQEMLALKLLLMVAGALLCCCRRGDSVCRRLAAPAVGAQKGCSERNRRKNAKLEPRRDSLAAPGGARNWWAACRC